MAHSDETKDKIRAGYMRAKAVGKEMRGKPFNKGVDTRRCQSSPSRPFDDVCFETKRLRVIAEQDGKCAGCGIGEWRGRPLSLEVDHRNGNNRDDSRENLSAVCPNCHSQTEGWRGRNKNRIGRVGDDDLRAALARESSAHRALISVGLSPRGANYRRVKRLLN
jgi:hypothetical protein